MTAVGNDYGFDQVFARQIEALVRPSDVVVLFSTSGRSPNLLEAARAARQRAALTLAFTGPATQPARRESPTTRLPSTAPTPRRSRTPTTSACTRFAPPRIELLGVVHLRRQ